MIKAVFFDWVGTLSHPEPDRDASVHKAAREIGVELPLENLLTGILKADNQVPEGAPPCWHEGAPEEPFLRWWKVLLAEVGADLSREEMLDITGTVGKRIRALSWVLYDDVIPVVEELKQRGLILGLISAHYIGRAGMGPYLDVVVTARDAGADKPEPPIFMAAVERAAVDATEALYIGDQYERDIVGARRVGINAVLIDRYDLFPGITDCPRIKSLNQVFDYL